MSRISSRLSRAEASAHSLKACHHPGHRAFAVVIESREEVPICPGCGQPPDHLITITRRDQEAADARLATWRRDTETRR